MSPEQALGQHAAAAAALREFLARAPGHPQAERARRHLAVCERAAREASGGH